jgi:hypothetical protein
MGKERKHKLGNEEKKTRTFFWFEEAESEGERSSGLSVDEVFLFSSPLFALPFSPSSLSLSKTSHCSRCC